MGELFSFTLTATNGVGFCEDYAECTSSFTVHEATPLVFPTPQDGTISACSTQDQVNTAFGLWIDDIIANGATGGCNRIIDHNALAAPDRCGGTLRVEFHASSTCDNQIFRYANFTVTEDEPPSIDCIVSGYQVVDANSGTNYI
ncbi:MAG: hypothetical protein IPI37_08155, partial [Bacteroidales bacterium]|nr:hypothetical protein [Bacteroidales bacterium]